MANERVHQLRGCDGPRRQTGEPREGTAEKSGYRRERERERSEEVTRRCLP